MNITENIDNKELNICGYDKIKEAEPIELYSPSKKNIENNNNIRYELNFNYE